MMPVRNLNKATSLKKDTKGVVQDQTMKHMDSDTGERAKRQGDNVSDHDEVDDNPYEELQDN